ncbi:asparagine synthase (glutamine-hydrolyzing) [Candidatus Woesearchaeota archaeon]|nr:asparagine synthase (glutamine-hydrolyzing) [Candidatus Woesearchaeota archaeon]
MCGINGFSWDDRQLIRNMNDILSYRGPDQSGVFNDRRMTLGHRRLSILDLSEKGRQPMPNEDQSIWLVFNGEIYNHMEIRKDLEEKGHRFLSNADSEVIIHAYEEYGKGCLKLFNGMFAFALWDSGKNLLFIARDRLGIKPLYYHYDGRNIIFSSEIKAILRNPLIRRCVDRSVLNQYLKYRFVLAEESFIEGIKKLMPGHYLIYKDNELSIGRYWDISWDPAIKKPLGYCMAHLERLLKDSVEKRLNSDVPLGAYLSGGLDSSLIAAINSELREDAVKTFTVGFGHETDEFSYARVAAEHIGTEHHELVLSYDKISRMLPKIIWHMDEPNTDITMVPLYFLSGFSRKKVTVVNTGEGADELFSGYHHYRIASKRLGFVPDLVKRSVYSWYYSPFKSGQRKALISYPYKEDRVLCGYLNAKKPSDILNRILWFDIRNELPNWQLHRVDRMTMAHSQEARVPFLDHRIVEFSARLPVAMKQPDLAGKYILKRIASKYLPKEIITRKKQGFTTPMHAWLKHSLEENAHEILSKEDITAAGLFNYSSVSDLLRKHRRSKSQLPFRPYSFQLLVLMMFQMWHKMYIENDCRIMRF